MKKGSRPLAFEYFGDGPRVGKVEPRLAGLKGKSLFEGSIDEEQWIAVEREQRSRKMSAKKAAGSSHCDALKRRWILHCSHRLE
jgi:hypothetical protein